MKRPILKPLLFRFIGLLLVIFFIESIGYIGLYINSRRFDFLSNKNYFYIRAMLMGDKNPDLYPRYLTLPYLGYIPYPGYRRNGIVQHNEDGYRGSRLPLQRDGRLRVLCLGGSTTYGYSVDTPSQAYPARLQVILDEKIRHDSVLLKYFSGAEVINAGIEAGSSAEELQQYLFKYRYYQPDVVIVHSGINDAMMVGLESDNIQLDYTNKRRLNYHSQPLQGPAKYMLHSYFMSFMMIYLFYEREYKRGDEFNAPVNQTYCKWTTIKMDTILANHAMNYYPFYRNTKSLFDEIVKDRSLLIVMPNVLKRGPDTSNSAYSHITKLNAEISRQLCDSVSGAFLPFTYDSIPQPDSWVDDCHLDAKGEDDKARMIANFILQTKLRDKLLIR